MSDAEILFEQRGALGLVTLNRPKALNALTLNMVRELDRALERWRDDATVKTVAIVGAGEKAFCAGGDIRLLWEQGQAGDHAAQLAFWREEYHLNLKIAAYPKPYVAIIDGIVMGGGVGVSFHGSHKVAGDRFSFAMPEVGIGFFPDVGATYFLPRLPGAIGEFIAISGERVTADDAAGCGLASHRVSSEGIPAMIAALAAGTSPDEALAAIVKPVVAGALAGHRHVIDTCFSKPSVADILLALDAVSGAEAEWAQRIAAAMRRKSPLSMAIAHEQMHRGGSLDIEEAMRTEFRIVSRLCRGKDFYEGVRAVIIDKDNAPRWSHAAPGEVDDGAVAAHFALLPPDQEL